MKKICIALVAVLMLAPLVSFAASNTSATVTANKTSLNPGDTTVVSVSIADVDQASQGIAKFEGILVYDTTIFEAVSSTSFENKNNWTLLGYETTSGHFSLVNSGWVKTNEEMFTVTLKVKEGATVGSTAVTFKDLKASDATSDIILSNKSVSINVLASSSNTNNKNVIINNNSIIDNNTVNNSTNVISFTNNSTNNTLSGTLPKAGLEDFTFVAFIIAIITSVVYYVMYKRIK